MRTTGPRVHPLKAILDEEGYQYSALAERVGLATDRFHRYLSGSRRMPSWVLVSLAVLVPQRRDDILALIPDPEGAAA